MTTVADPQDVPRRTSRTVPTWLPVLLGLAALYVPTLFDLARGLWKQDEHMHGPIVLAVALWLAWQAREAVSALQSYAAPSRVLGWLFVMVGLLFYVLGRSQEFILFEVGSIIPVILGSLLVTFGWRSVRILWFPLLFVCFMVPLPSIVVDALTNPLKHHVSVLAEGLLYAVGYPIARSGVVLSVGPYQLLVADACSGLHSIISMTAMGLLYVYLSRHSSLTRNALLASTLVPIAFAANVTRVVVLVLVTYYFGDEAGQGFIHGFSGVFLFVIGLLLLFLIDAALGRVPAFRDREVGR